VRGLEKLFEPGSPKGQIGWSIIAAARKTEASPILSLGPTSATMPLTLLPVKTSSTIVGGANPALANALPGMTKKGNFDASTYRPGFVTACPGSSNEVVDT